MISVSALRVLKVLCARISHRRESWFFFFFQFRDRSPSGHDQFISYLNFTPVIVHRVKDNIKTYSCDIAWGRGRGQGEANACIGGIDSKDSSPFSCHHELTYFEVYRLHEISLHVEIYGSPEGSPTFCRLRILKDLTSSEYLDLKDQRARILNELSNMLSVTFTDRQSQT